MPNSPEDHMSFQLGLVHFFLAVLGALLGWRNKTLRVAFSCYLLLLIMMTPLSKYLWTLPILRSAQFPWRILSVIAILQVLCCTGLRVIYPERTVKKFLVMLVVLSLAAIWYKQQFTVNTYKDPILAHCSYQTLRKERKAELTHFWRYVQMNEFLPRTATDQPGKGPRDGAPLLVLLSPGKTEALPRNNKFRIAYRVSTEGSATILINQLYLPGWKVLVDGKEVPRRTLERGLLADGRIQVRLSGGSRIVRAYYGGPPGWWLRDLIMALGVLAFLVRFLWRRHTRVPGRPI